MTVEDNPAAANVVLVQPGIRPPLSNPGPDQIRQFQKGACSGSLGTVCLHVAVVLPTSIVQGEEPIMYAPQDILNCRLANQSMIAFSTEHVDMTILQLLEGRRSKL
jgi:hypothetical protein